jgi:hypothetical protein
MRVLNLSFDDYANFSFDNCKALKSVGITIQDFQLLFPIPNSQVQIYNNPTGFSQNQGY